jgi:hypothetical protein
MLSAIDQLVEQIDLREQFAKVAISKKAPSCGAKLPGSLLLLPRCATVRRSTRYRSTENIYPRG